MAKKKSSGSSEVKNEMHRYKRGKAKSGPGGKGGKVKEPQASDCDWPLKGAEKGQEGAAQEVGLVRSASVASQNLGGFEDFSHRRSEIRALRAIGAEIARVVV